MDQKDEIRNVGSQMYKTHAPKTWSGHGVDMDECKRGDSRDPAIVCVEGWRGMVHVKILEPVTRGSFEIVFSFRKKTKSAVEYMHTLKHANVVNLSKITTAFPGYLHTTKKRTVLCPLYVPQETNCGIECRFRCNGKKIY